MPPKQMSLNQLTPEQLRGLLEQLDNDVASLNRAYEALREARSRFQESKFTLEGFKAHKEGDEILVPLTSSLYIPGKVKTSESVLVDVGTGYYVKQELPRAQNFFQRRADQMRDQMEKVADSMNGKKHHRQAIMDAMRQQQAAMEQQA